MRLASWAFLVIAAATVSTAFAAEPVPVRFELAGKNAGGPVEGTLTLTPTMGPGKPIDIPCCGGEMAVALPANSAWELQPRLHGGWAAKEIVVVGDRPAVHQIKVWPAARVRGRIQLEKVGEGLPQALDIELVDTPTRKSGIPPGNSVTCTVELDTTFQCDLPALHVDLRLTANGYVPAQLWDMDLRPAAARDVGSIFLRRGASVAGWVENGGGAATVTISQMAAGGGATAERVARPAAVAKVLKNGFFQLAGIAPGQYVVRAERPGYASEAVGPVGVYGGAETRLRKAIVLRPPVDVTLSIAPTTDWHGEPWGLLIEKASPLSGGFDSPPLFQGHTTDGRVVLHAQSAGRFSVDVLDSAGNPMKSEQFDIDGAADAHHAIHVDVIRITGTVSLGDAPLETTLWFGGRYGVPHAAVRANDKGEFHGVLPNVGDWRVTAVVDGQDVETVAAVKARDGEAHVEVRLPDNRLGGVVVDDKGNPVADADVTLVMAREALRRRSGQNGEFSFRCIVEGEVSLSANARRKEKQLMSEAVSASIAPGAVPPPVQLVLHEGQRLNGTIKSIHAAIAGAAVTAVPVVDSGNAATATSDLDGHFTVFLPVEASRAFVTVNAPGYALRVFDVVLPDHGLGFNVPLVGGTLDLVFPKLPAGRQNVALLLFQDDRPLPLPLVARWAMTHGSAPSDAGLHATDMAPAQYKACIGVQQFVRRQDAPRWNASARCVTGALAPYGTLRLDIPSPPAD